MKNTDESGRSMVEMLGVLAVIGVLSVSGVAGIQSALNKHYTNILIQEAQKRAVIIVGQIGLNNTAPSLAEFTPHNTTSAGTFSSDIITTGLTGQFGIKVENVKKSVCQNVLNIINDNTSIRWVVPVNNLSATMKISDCQESNNLVFGYNNDLESTDKNSDTQSCTQNSECGYCKTCVRGKCLADTLCDNHCPGDKPILTTYGTCITCPSAEKGERLEYQASASSECAKCNFPVYSGGTCRQNVCPPGYWLSYWNTCMNCNEYWGGAWKTCESACPNRTQTGSSGNSSGTCKIALTTCSDEQGITREGICYDCALDYPMYVNNSSDTALCSRCPNRDLIPETNRCIRVDCPNGWGTNNDVRGCCTDDEIFIKVGNTTLGKGEYGYCCPKTRPNWDGSKCNP